MKEKNRVSLMLLLLYLFLFGLRFEAQKHIFIHLLPPESDVHNKLGVLPPERGYHKNLAQKYAIIAIDEVINLPIPTDMILIMNPGIAVYSHIHSLHRLVK